MSTTLQVIALMNGNFAVHALGGNALSRILGEFPTRAEAESAMMRQSLSAQSGLGIMLPGADLGLT